MELTGNETWIAAGVGMIGMIVSFFFGKAGVFQKTVDFIFKSKRIFKRTFIKYLY